MSATDAVGAKPPIFSHTSMSMLLSSPPLGISDDGVISDIDEEQMAVRRVVMKKFR